MSDPAIIQGGMGVGVSGWQLARAVSQEGQLGVVSGTALDTVVARRLQDGDRGGHVRWALRHFPVPEMAKRILDRYFRPGGKQATSAFRGIPMYTIAPAVLSQELSIVANFAEVFLAKEGHQGEVGINFLEKIQLPMLPSLYGAMLAGVDYVLVGAGIPREIPAVIDGLVKHRVVSLKPNVIGSTADDEYEIVFSPNTVVPQPLPRLRRPKFVAIVASATLAASLLKRSRDRIDGFVVEGPTAGGHNAPPRGRMRLNERAEPIYGPRDEVDLKKVASLGRPFWLAGSYGRPGKLQEALSAGATGIQVGTAFAFCEESALADDIKKAVLQQVRRGDCVVLTDAAASPTDFPFKVVQLEGSVSDPLVYATRPSVCDVGLLRSMYKKSDGSVGYRCPGEPLSAYLKKGGAVDETRGRRCLCNGLLATIGLGQRHADGYLEPPLVTAGDHLQDIEYFLPARGTAYSAGDVIRELMGNSHN